MRRTIQTVSLPPKTSMKAVEVRARALAEFGADAIGVDLMNRAFGPNGSLTDTIAVKCEQDGTRALFTGAYGVLRNPSGHPRGALRRRR